MTPPNLVLILQYGGWLCLLGGGLLSALVWLFPRVFLKRFPAEVRAAVPPLSPREKRLGWIVGLPFLALLIVFPALAAWRVDVEAGGEASPAALFVAAYGVWMLFNLFDWLVLDMFLIGVLRPSSLRLEGAEGVDLRFDHAQHAQDFVKGCVNGAILAGVIAAALTVL